MLSLLSALFVPVYLVKVISDADESQEQVAGYSSFCYEGPRGKVISEEADELLIQGIPPGHEEGEIERECKFTHAIGPDQGLAPLLSDNFYHTDNKGTQGKEKQTQQESLG